MPSYDSSHEPSTGHEVYVEEMPGDYALRGMFSHRYPQPRSDFIDPFSGFLQQLQARGYFDQRFKAEWDKAMDQGGVTYDTFDRLETEWVNFYGA